MTLAINLPGDGREGRANLVVTLCTSGGSGVDGNISSLACSFINNHTREEVRVVVGFIIDHSKGLRLHSNIVSNLLRSECLKILEWKVAEDTIIYNGIERFM